MEEDFGVFINLKNFQLKKYICASNIFYTKKNFLLLFCFISGFVFSQEYHFDYFIKEKSMRTKPQKEEWFNDWFANSVTGHEVFLRNYNNKTIAVIYLRNENLKHVFKVNKFKYNINFFINTLEKLSMIFNKRMLIKEKKLFK
ncbi:hypothetical protein ACFQO9_13990 [Chryseobacterium zhengzhouense]|uniref:Uncharacterized protein n=1 Tax=Chryseobacterium zhengzhouense TaxID=1636086 RepID=A0ABW2M2S9_9FLAO